MKGMKRYIYRNRQILFVSLAFLLFWSCKEADVDFIPNVNVEKFKNDTLDVSSLPPIQEPDNGTGTGVPQKEVLHVVRLLGGGTNATIGNFIDLSNGRVFSNNEVLDNLNQVDLMMINFGTTALNNIIVPDSKEIAYNSYGNDIQRGWDVQNKGLLYRLNDLQASDIEWFNKTIKNQDLKRGVDSFINNIIPVRNAIEYNDAKSQKRLRNTTGNSIIFFKSIDRNISSAIVVTNSSAASLGTEYVRLNIKSDVSAKTEVVAGSGSLKATRNDLDIFTINYDNTKEQFISFNFADGVYYPTVNDIPNPSSVYLVFTFSPSNKRTFIYTPQSGFYTNWKATGSEAYTNKLTGSTTYTRFSVISTNANYAANTLESVFYSTDNLKTYYTALNTSATAFSSHTGTALYTPTTVYPYVNRFARTSVSGALPIVEYGAFSVIENDPNNGKLVFGYKYSTIQD